MCGINGIISKKNNLDINQIYRMNESIKHRGPDDQGAMIYKNASLGHVRLSIQDLSTKGKQPMSVDKNLWIIFNGEIYNFKEIRKELLNLGYKFYSNTDTEVILNSYKEWGNKCFAKFNGMWCFALLDKEKNKILICRDRYGVKPCYIGRTDDKIIFSSEIKGIIASKEDFDIDPNKAFLDDQKKESYFTTSFNNINIIEPGHFYSIDIKNFTILKERWWNSLESIPSISPNYSIIKETVREKLINATKLRLVSDAKIATSLSGGIDSSIIFSILNSLEKNDKLNLNPFIVKYEGNLSFKAALGLVKSKGRKPIIIETNNTLDKDGLNNLPQLFSSLEITNPFGKQSKLKKKKKERGFKVSIDGHGADESHGGYERNLKIFAFNFQNSLLSTYDALNKMKGNKNLNLLHEQNYLVPINKKVLLDPSIYYNNQKIKNSYIEQNQFAELPNSLIADLKELKNFSYSFGTLYLDSQYGFLQWLLNKWDKASMASSIEVRSPFLDKDFFQYSLAIPSELKVLNGVNKSILRDSFKDDLTEEINNFHIKQGLPMQKTLVNENLYNLIENTINEKDFKTSPHWDGKNILKDFYNSEKKLSKINEIWEITRLYLQKKGFKERIPFSSKVKIGKLEDFNYLNIN